MHVSTADELAAIAAAYVAVMSPAEMPAQPAETSRWRLAGRLPDIDEQRVRFAAVTTARWNAAGRLDG
jgi:hypothetical protein